MEPIYGILLTALVFGSEEFMSHGFYIGAAIFIGIVNFVPLLEK